MTNAKWPDATIEERLLLRVREAAALTGVSLSKAYELVATGTWPSVRMGASVRVPAAGLRVWIEKNTTGGQAA